MAIKTKGLTFDSATEQLVEVKADLKDARGEMTDFLKANKLKKGQDHSNHETAKVAKGWTKADNKISKLEEDRTTLQDFVKANKPKKERESKYSYPDGLDADGRKKFRTQIRAKAKRAGMTPDEYLDDPKAGDKIIAGKDAERAEKKSKKAPKAKKEKAEKSDKKVPKPKKKPKKSKAAEEEEED